MPVENYDISNHKTFKLHDIVIGIGLEEIGISDNLNGCVSPVYDVYKLNNDIYFQSLKYTLKRQLWAKRNYISRKSTRREFEVDKRELDKLYISMLTDLKFKKYYDTLDTLNSLLQNKEQKLQDLLKIKEYLLNNMFI